MEPDVRTEVVTTSKALIAAPAWLARFDRHPFADARLGNSAANLDYLARRLVTEDQRALDHEVADPSVLVVVDVGPAHAY